DGILKVTGQFLSLITGLTCDSMMRMIGEKSGKPLMRMLSTCKKISLVPRTEKWPFNQTQIAMPLNGTVPYTNSDVPSDHSRMTLKALAARKYSCSRLMLTRP